MQVAPTDSDSALPDAHLLSVGARRKEDGRYEESQHAEQSENLAGSDDGPDPSPLSQFAVSCRDLDRAVLRNGREYRQRRLSLASCQVLRDDSDSIMLASNSRYQLEAAVNGSSCGARVRDAKTFQSFIFLQFD